MVLNVECGVAGFVAVEVLSGGKAATGMELEASDHIKGSAVRAVASWGKGQLATLSGLAGKQVKVRVTMTDCKLFSMQPVCAHKTQRLKSDDGAAVSRGPARAAAKASVRLIGMYDADSPDHPPGGSDPALKGWTNLAMSTAVNAAAASRHGGPTNQLLTLEDVLFDTNTSGNRAIELLPDWRQRWSALVPLAKALFANHSAAGFFFGDELVGGGGLPLASLVLATDRVRVDFPVERYPEAILFENEAAHIFLWKPEDGHGGPNRWANFTEWPRSLTHVSVDIYHFLPQGHAPILCDGGQLNCTAECIPTPSTPAWSAKVTAGLGRIATLHHRPWPIDPLYRL